MKTLSIEKLLSLWQKSYSGIPDRDIAFDLYTSFIVVIKTALRKGRAIELQSMGVLKPIIRKGGFYSV